LEELGIYLQPPYAFDEVFTLLLQKFEYGQKLMALGSTKPKKIARLKAINISINKWDWRC
jgi:hypothetical protein